MLSLVLASKSPQRSALLTQIGLSFTTISLGEDAEYLETPFPQEFPLDYVRRVAHNKWYQAQQQLLLTNKNPLIIVSADTCVCLDNQIFHKPETLDQAKEILKTLSGKTHHVLTTVCVGLLTTKQPISNTSKNQVRFCNMSESQIDYYLKTQESFGRAGAYAIQGLAAQFIEWIEGSYSGIMGLPLYETKRMIDNVILDFLTEQKHANATVNE
jgi:septum formation protein